MFVVALVIVIIALLFWIDWQNGTMSQLKDNNKFHSDNHIEYKAELAKVDNLLKLANENAELMNQKYLEQTEKNKELLSQKKSSETRLGQTTEHLVPFLEECKHAPANMKFLGMPIDYVVFDLDQGEITFLEVKTGNAKESARQRTIKNIIKSGKVFYETMRISDKGVISKKINNDP